MPKIGVQSRSLPRTIPLKPELLKRKVYLGKLPIYRLSMRRVRKDSKERVRRVRRRFDILRDWRLQGYEQTGTSDRAGEEMKKY
jgi:hypothetical protein